MRQPLRTLLLAIATQSLLLSPSVQAAEEVPAPSPDMQTEAGDERAQLQERQLLTSTALQRSLPTAEQQTLQTAEETFLALWRPANSAKPHGVVILLHGAGESADWPITIGPLRSKLPDAQWHTLSLSLPDPQPDKIGAPISAGTLDEGAEAPDKDATTDKPADSENGAGQLDAQKAYAARVNARLTSAIAFAKASKPAEIILLGHGSGGFWATQFLSEEKNSSVTRLLLISAKMPEGTTPPLEESLPALTLPIGDFYFSANAEPERAVQRKQAAVRSQHPAYQQTVLSALPGNSAVEQEQLYRRVRGWLEKPATPARSPAEMKKQPAQAQRKP